MDLFLHKLTQNAINYAIRSGITITAGYAAQHAGQLLRKVEAPEDREELQELQERLQSKIKIISPAIDMIELVSARGNTTLESAVELTGKLRQNIQAIALRLERAATEETLTREGHIKRSKADIQLDIKGIIKALKRLLRQIEDAVPFLNLAITASGAKISSNMPSTISPSRLLQASTFLTAADSQYSLHPTATQVGPTFTLSLYMLFSGHVRPQSEEDVQCSTWKEVMHKAKLKLMRVPLDTLGQGQNPATASNLEGATTSNAEEFAYQLLVIEDLDDDRVHTYEEEDGHPGSFDEVSQAGIREAIPVHELSKIFYADTGKILNIGSEDDINRPILLLKRDKDAIAPRRIAEELAAPLNTLQADPLQAALDAQLSGSVPETNPQKEENPSKPEHPKWRIPAYLDPEWLAFEVYTEESDTEEDDEDDSVEDDKQLSRPKTGVSRSRDSSLESRMAAIQLSSPGRGRPGQRGQGAKPINKSNPFPQIRTSLSLLEVLLRLSSLQQFQQMSHLSIEDELLNFFLGETSNTGAANGDEHERRRLREDAKRRVGFDPYNESPIKRRGEEYQYRGGMSQVGWGGMRSSPEFETPDLEDQYILPSIEDAGYEPRQLRTGVITPSDSRSPKSDLPPLGIRNRRSSSKKTMDRSTPPTSSSRSSLSPSMQRHTLLRPTGQSAKMSPLVQSTALADDGPGEANELKVN